MSSAIILSDADNILTGATVGGTAPVTSYTASDIISKAPERRILFGATSIDETFTIASKTGAVAVLPVTNCDPSVVSITNNNGLNVAFPIPALPANRIPLTAILDFSAQANRTATIWHLIVTSNSANVVLGGGFGIYSAMTVLDRNFGFGWHDREQHKFIENNNEYGVRLRYDLRTQLRSADYVVPATEAGQAALRVWYRANHSQPGVLWPDPTVNDAYLGTWDSFDVERQPQGAAALSRVTITFDELCKGLPV